ncbi:MAG: MBL fold metallo-hydrolase [Phycisphaerae bacterium]|nr:MBL fold metallo-hydrolase [Phycisphaerae bacterium]
MTPDLARRISDMHASKRSAVVWWLGQAGFALKTPAGEVVLVDPYLSDSCEREHGLKRLSASPLDPEDARADWVLFTHEHTDHVDPDTVAAIARNCPACRFAGPAGCRDPLAKLAISFSRFTLLTPGDNHELGGFSVRTAPADHGQLSPSATMLLVEIAGVRIVFTGDTSFRPDLIAPLLDRPIDLLLPCINGGFGNMGHIDAARLVQTVKPRRTAPCHFWTFAEQGAGDPWGFIQACKFLCPDVAAVLFKPGESLVLEAP